MNDAESNAGGDGNADGGEQVGEQGRAALSPAARKTLYRCTHRGTKELDLMLGSFARQHVPTMDAQTLRAFNDFTELPEPVLTEILTHKLPLPVDMPAHLAALLAAFTYQPTPR